MAKYVVLTVTVPMNKMIINDLLTNEYNAIRDKLEKKKFLEKKVYSRCTYLYNINDKIYMRHLSWNDKNIIGKLLFKESFKINNDNIKCYIILTLSPIMINHGAGPTVPMSYFILFDINYITEQRYRSIKPIYHLDYASNLNNEPFDEKYVVKTINNRLSNEDELKMIDDIYNYAIHRTNASDDFFKPYYTKEWKSYEQNTCIICLEQISDQILFCNEDKKNCGIHVCKDCVLLTNKCPICNNKFYDNATINFI
jgi:hypothetical protein